MQFSKVFYLHPLNIVHYRVAFKQDCMHELEEYESFDSFRIRKVKYFEIELFYKYSIPNVIIQLTKTSIEILIAL